MLSSCILLVAAAIISSVVPYAITSPLEKRASIDQSCNPDQQGPISAALPSMFHQAQNAGDIVNNPSPEQQSIIGKYFHTNDTNDLKTVAARYWAIAGVSSRPDVAIHCQSSIGNDCAANVYGRAAANANVILAVSFPRALH